MTIHKQSILLIAFIIFIWASGCANTVTDKTTTLTMRVQLQLEKDISTHLEQYNYHIIFSKVASPNIALPTFISLDSDYFPTPGQTLEDANQIFIDRGINYFYQNYFNTWSDYIIINNTIAKFYTSNGNGFDATTTSNLTYSPKENFKKGASQDYTYAYNPTTKIITFTFDVSHLSSSLSGTRYIQIMTSEKTTSLTQESGYFRDKLSEAKAIILGVNEWQYWDNELTQPSIPGQTDITRCYIEIY